MRITRAQSQANPQVAYQVAATYNAAVGLPAPQAPPLPAVLVQRLQAAFSHSQLADIVTIAERLPVFKARVVHLTNSAELTTPLENAKAILAELQEQLTDLFTSYNAEQVAAKSAALQLLNTQVPIILITSAQGANSIQGFKDAVLDTFDTLINDGRFAAIQEELALVKNVVENLANVADEAVTNSVAIQNEAVDIAIGAMGLAGLVTRLFNSVVNNLPQ